MRQFSEAFGSLAREPLVAAGRGSASSTVASAHHRIAVPLPRGGATSRCSIVPFAVSAASRLPPILAVRVLPTITRIVRRRRFWCDRAQGEVEVEFEEQGLIGFRRAVAVRSCSVF